MATFTTGFTTPYFSYTDSGSAAQSFADLRATGANSVIIDLPLFQASLTSSNVGYASGSTLQNLTTLIQLAEQQGLDVWVKPLVLVDGAPGQWWKIAPIDPNAWFQSYDQLLVAIGQTMQQAGATHYLLANELISMWNPVYNPQWTTAISEVRSVFSGQIGFDTPGPGENPGDATNNAAFNFPLYNLVDFVGLDMYPVFNSSTGSFTPAEIQSGWTSDAFGQNITQALDNFFARVHLPIYLTEFGDPTILTGNKAYYSIGPNGAPPDPQGQAIFYNTSLSYIRTNFSNSIDGVFVYDWELNEGNAQAQTPGNDRYDWDVFGKPAQQVITAAYGGQDVMKPFDTSFIGSVGNDQVCLYGNAVQVTTSTPVTQSQTFATTVSVTIDGTIISGQAPTVHFYLNGIDEGAHTLQTTPSSFVDQHGVTWTVPQTFTFTLNGLINISELKVAIDSPVNIGGVENSQTFISSVTIDGVALTEATYNPLHGPSQQLTLTAGGQYDGGNEVINASPWNSQLVSRDIGGAANPIQVNGGGGTDTIHVLGSPSNYTIALVNGNTVVLTENAGLDQNAILTNISYIDFQSGATVSLSTVPAVAVEGSMYGEVGSSAEVTLLTTQFLPGQIANATANGLNPLVYACEALGLAFAFGNEAGSTAFSTAFGPSNTALPNSTTGDAAFAVAASTAIFGSASTTNLVNVLESFVSNWKTFYTSSGIPGISNVTLAQIDLAARGAAWGDMVGVALANNLGPLNGQAMNFLEDAAQGTAVYSASLSSQPNHVPFQAATASVASAASEVQLTGVAAHVDHIVM